MKISPLTALIALFASTALRISHSVAAEKPVVADWPHLLGPAYNCTTPESGLLRKFPAEGLRVLWEMPLGKGMGGPAIIGGRIVVFHRLADQETVASMGRAAHADAWERFELSAFAARFEAIYREVAAR